MGNRVRPASATLATGGLLGHLAVHLRAASGPRPRVDIFRVRARVSFCVALVAAFGTLMEDPTDLGRLMQEFLTLNHTMAANATVRTETVSTSVSTCGVPPA